MLKNKLKSNIASIAVGIALIIAPSAALAASNNGNNDNNNGSDNEHNKVTICHRTSSTNNPYEIKTPNANGNIDGHDGHTGPVFPATGPDGKWGDIIPPFDYTDHQVTNHYPGLNWTTAGQATYRNECVPVTPEEEFGSITLVKHLSPATDSGLFNLKVNEEVVATNVGNNGQGTASELPAGDYVVAEAAGTGTSLTNYVSSVACTNDSTGTTSATVHLTAGDTVTCTFTNTKGGQGGGPTGGTTTTTTTGQVLGTSTTAATGQVALLPQGSVNGGEGAAALTASHLSVAGLIGSLMMAGSGLAMLNRRPS